MTARLYGELADWFHLVTSPEEYEVEAEYYARWLREPAEIPVRRVLELGSGGGNNASHLKADYEMTLVDLSPEMLEISMEINPECEHIQGDMRTVRLDRQFDAVFVHDAVEYMLTEEDLSASIETAYVHCAPGGVALFTPDQVRETFSSRTDCGGNDRDGRGLRYLEWVSEPKSDGPTYTVDYAYLIKDADGSMRVEHDHHTCGIFPRATWMHLLEKAGFRAERRDGIEDETGTDIFVGVRPVA